jgi:polar amino acid transport system substrate-binding protein
LPLTSALFRSTLVFILVIAFPIGKALADTINIAAENSWSPYSDHLGLGITHDIVSAAFAVTGHTITIEALPYSRVLRHTANGVADAGWNVTREKSTESIFTFGTEPLFQAVASHYFPPGQAKLFSNARNIPEGTKIGVMLNYEYGDDFSANIYRFELTEVKSQTQLIRMLASGRIDMAIMFDDIAEFTLKEMGWPSSAIVKGNSNHVSDIYLAFNKDSSKSVQYAADLDRGLRQIKSDDTFKEIFSTYR